MISRAILLAAGEGQRLRPLTTVLPKCLVPVNGKPLLGFWIDRLTKAGISKICVNTCHLGDLVTAYLRNGDWQCQIDLIHETSLRGTGGTLVDLLPFWREHGTLLLHADNFGNMDFLSLLSAHEARPAPWLVTMATFETDAPQECGIVELLPDGSVSAFYEKVPDPPGSLASAAVFAIAPDLSRYLPAHCQAPTDFSADVLPRLIGHLGAWNHMGFHRDLGQGTRYFRTQWEAEPSIGQYDGAWSALLANDHGKLRERIVQTLAQLAVTAGWQPKVYAHMDLALSPKQGTNTLAIILKANQGDSSAELFRTANLRSVILEIEN